MTDVTVTVT